MIAERVQEQLQGLRLNQPVGRHIVDDQMGEIRLASQRAKGGEFGRSETHEIGRSWMRIGNPLQNGFLRRLRNRDGGAKLRQAPDVSLAHGAGLASFCQIVTPAEAAAQLWTLRMKL